MLATRGLKYSTEIGAGPFGAGAGAAAGGGGAEVAAVVFCFFGVEQAASITATATAVRNRSFIILPLGFLEFLGRNCQFTSGTHAQSPSFTSKRARSNRFATLLSLLRPSKITHFGLGLP